MVFFATTFWAGTILTGCQSPNEKVKDAKEDVTEAQQELQDAKTEAANDAAWKAYKEKVDRKMDTNDSLIAELKLKMKKTGKTVDKAYNEQIDALEEKNKKLRKRMNEYNGKLQRDWASFEREFEHDMDELGAALNDLFEDNKK